MDQPGSVACPVVWSLGLVRRRVARNLFRATIR